MLKVVKAYANQEDAFDYLFEFSDGYSVALSEKNIAAANPSGDIIADGRHEFPDEEHAKYIEKNLDRFNKFTTWTRAAANKWASIMPEEAGNVEWFEINESKGNRNMSSRSVILRKLQEELAMVTGDGKGVQDKAVHKSAQKPNEFKKKISLIGKARNVGGSSIPDGKPDSGKDHGGGVAMDDANGNSVQSKKDKAISGTNSTAGFKSGGGGHENGKKNMEKIGGKGVAEARRRRFAESIDENMIKSRLMAGETVEHDGIFIFIGADDTTVYFSDNIEDPNDAEEQGDINTINLGQRLRKWSSGISEGRTIVLPHDVVVEDDDGVRKVLAAGTKIVIGEDSEKPFWEKDEADKEIDSDEVSFGGDVGDDSDPDGIAKLMGEIEGNLSDLKKAIGCCDEDEDDDDDDDDDDIGDLDSLHESSAKKK